VDFQLGKCWKIIKQQIQGESGRMGECHGGFQLGFAQQIWEPTINGTWGDAIDLYKAKKKSDGSPNT